MIPTPTTMMTVESIIKTAIKAAEETKDANYINIRWSGATATITTHVNGVDAAWINMNVEQLDELIRLAMLARSEMVK